VPRFTYVYDDGSRQTVRVAAATNLMKAALAHQVPGIIGECGGAATCGTCHIYLAHSTEEFAPPSPDEEDMLEWTASERAANSRLSCQLAPTREDTELVVHVPNRQV
jgi:ferredoxin, 2Fe-2S